MGGRNCDCGLFRKTSGLSGVGVNLAEIELAGEEQGNGTNGGEVAISALLALGARNRPLMASRKPFVWRSWVQATMPSRWLLQPQFDVTLTGRHDLMPEQAHQSGHRREGYFPALRHDDQRLKEQHKAGEPFGSVGATCRMSPSVKRTRGTRPSMWHLRQHGRVALSLGDRTHESHRRGTGDFRHDIVQFEVAHQAALLNVGMQRGSALPVPPCDGSR